MLEKPTVPKCNADNDGDCEWAECPQLRDGEPKTSGRHCPYDAEWGRYYESNEF